MDSLLPTYGGGGSGGGGAKFFSYPINFLAMEVDFHLKKNRDLLHFLKKLRSSSIFEKIDVVSKIPDQYNFTEDFDPPKILNPKNV